MKVYVLVIYVLSWFVIDWFLVTSFIIYSEKSRFVFFLSKISFILDAFLSSKDIFGSLD